MLEKVSLNGSWKFHRANDALLQPYERLLVTGDYTTGGPAFALDDSDWQMINLPHDFVVSGNFTDAGQPITDYPQDNPLLWSGSLLGGVGWYRKRFRLPGSDEGQRIYLYFEGVFRDCKVYLNQCFVGTHRSGYASFYFDVTDLVEFGGENLLVVRADATVPEGWFYEGGGLYRNVWLVKTPPVHVAPWGVFASSTIDFQGHTPHAVVTVKVQLLNRKRQPIRVRLTNSLVSHDQAVHGEAAAEITIPAWGETEEIHQITVEDPQLWSLEQPNLYQLVTRLQPDDDAVSDTVITTIGIRAIRFDPDQGFFLNNQSVKIKGVCCHQDHAGVGAALPDGLQEYRIRKLKEMGCNAYRSAHHPPSPALLDVCDRLGMLVMDENRQFSSAPDDLADLDALIRRDRNHPSVIIWCIGNEEVGIQSKPQAQRIAATMVERVHQIDPTRPVTLATTFWDASVRPMKPMALNEPTTSNEQDVMGFNYNDHFWQEYHQQNPQHPIVISEASSNFRTRGCYQSDDRLCFLDWTDKHSQCGAETQWAKVAQNAYLSGIFLWTGFDYRGEPLPFGWPGISSNFGLMDTCGFPKDNYYYYKAWWTDAPLVHIFPHWNWPNRAGQLVSVGCYSNCDEVELLLNGKSLGCKPMPRHGHLEWDVIYTPGVLEARGYRGGQILETHRIETTGAPHAVRVWTDFVQPGPQGIAVVNAAVADDTGRVIPTADHLISFTVDGNAAIIGVGNGNPSSHEPDHAAYRRAFHGLCQVILQYSEETAPVVLSAQAEGILSAHHEIVPAA